MMTKELSADPALRFTLNGAQMKWTAILAMAIDHVGAILLEPYLVSQGIDAYGDFTQPLVAVLIAMRLIGRLAFPLFAFLLFQGFMHSSNPYRYGLRLLIFALLSEVPFDLASTGAILEFTHQNVYFELALGLFTLIGIRKCAEQKWLQLMLMALASVLAWLLAFDYIFLGILIIVAFYLFRNQRAFLYLAQSLLNLPQLTAVFALPIIALYNGERGRQMKAFFYWFYPVHLMMLYALRKWLLP